MRTHGSQLHVQHSRLPATPCHLEAAAWKTPCHRLHLAKPDAATPEKLGQGRKCHQWACKQPHCTMPSAPHGHSRNDNMWACRQALPRQIFPCLGILLLIALWPSYVALCANGNTRQSVRHGGVVNHVNVRGGLAGAHPLEVQHHGVVPCLRHIECMV